MSPQSACYNGHQMAHSPALRDPIVFIPSGPARECFIRTIPQAKGRLRCAVTGGGIMRVRYRQGYLRLGHRKSGPDCWEFLWWDSESPGKRIRRRAVIGTIRGIQMWKTHGRPATAFVCRSMKLETVSVNKPLSNTRRILGNCHGMWCYMNSQ